jgi:excisionase family DNA binding protein
MSGTIIVSIEWDGIYGPYGSKDIQKILENHYNSHFKVHWVNSETNQPKKLAYSVGEASKLLGISAAKLYSLLYQKQIPSIQYGKRWLIPKVALEKQLGGSIEQEQELLMNEIERASLVTTAKEALKLYDLLRGMLEILVKHLTDQKRKIQLKRAEEQDEC